jgi:sigma-B regulation protein RsbU (phosphoserine phosphatase)
MPDISFTSHTLPMPPGSGLFIYSDGITEATDHDGRLFGETLLGQTLGDCRDYDSEKTSTQVLMQTQAFVRGAAQSDDMTMLCLRRPGGD